MGSSVKQRPGGVYGFLLRLYPQSFQQHYAITMQQTFDDMLSSETSGFGRFMIWARTLADLPVSASKEHLIGGKEFSMSKNAKLIIGAVVAILLLANIGSWWFGTLHARGAMGVEQVTTAQLADAMQNDDFYSTYGDAAVLFSGKVASIKTNGGPALVTFATGRPYSLTCQFVKITSSKVSKGTANTSVTQTANSLQVGQTISVAAPAGSAERQQHGVLLHNCVQN